MLKNAWDWEFDFLILRLYTPTPGIAFDFYTSVLKSSCPWSLLLKSANELDLIVLLNKTVFGLYDPGPGSPVYFF